MLVIIIVYLPCAITTPTSLTWLYVYDDHLTWIWTWAPLIKIIGETYTFVLKERVLLYRQFFHIIAIYYYVFLTIWLIFIYEKFFHLVTKY